MTENPVSLIETFLIWNGISKRKLIFFSTDVAESAFLGAGWFGDDSQNINCLCLPLLICLPVLSLTSSDLLFFHLLLSLFVYTPPFPSSHP